MKKKIELSWHFGLLALLSRKNYLRVRWHSFGRLCVPMVSLVVFGKRICGTDIRGYKHKT